MRSLHSDTVILLMVFIQIDGQIENCGIRSPARNPLLLNAHPTSQWPWHAAIYHLKNGQSEYNCGGTLINSNLVLTAAHCICEYDRPLANFEVSVTLGRHNLAEINESNAQNFEVAEILPHPNYTSVNFNNDIGIIRLASVVTININVLPVCLRPAKEMEFSEIIGKLGTVVGWGKTEMGEISNVLRQASLPVVSTRKCLTSNRSFFKELISETNFCAGLQNGTSVCNGDSGGSMTFEENGIYSIRGIVSVGAANEDKASMRLMCDSTHYAIFTDVAQYLPWIDEVVEVTNVAKGCKVNVGCSNTREFSNKGDEYLLCEIHLKNVNLSERNCKIIFNEDSNSSITWIPIYGEFEAVPELSDVASKFEYLRVLVMSTTKLQIVERSKLSPFKRMEKIFLDRNKISKLDADTFDDLKNLKTIDLHSNQLTELSADLLMQLYNLKEFFIYNNQIEILPAGLFRNNQKLEKLSADENRIKIIDPDLFQKLPNLKFLFLNSNQIDFLPEDVFRNSRNLQQLELARNQLKDLHRDILKDLNNLQWLILNDNRLEILPEGLFRNNQKLIKIHLQGNNLRRIESDLHNLGKLSELNLRRNECIDVFCDVKTFCGTNSLIEMQKKIWKEC